MANKKFDQKSTGKYKKLLLELREKIMGDIHQMRGDTNTEEDRNSDSGHALHMADVATDMYDREFSLGLASNDRELLRKINAALQRIEDGTFGYCLATGNPISKKRLEAIPYAEYCLEYQEQLERQ